MVKNKMKKEVTYEWSCVSIGQLSMKLVSLTMAYFILIMGEMPLTELAVIGDLMQELGSPGFFPLSISPHIFISTLIQEQPKLKMLKSQNQENPTKWESMQMQKQMNYSHTVQVSLFFS